jgi:hypothetical protein
MRTIARKVGWWLQGAAWFHPLHPTNPEPNRRTYLLGCRITDWANRR